MRSRRLAGVSLTPVLVASCGQVLGLDGDSVVRGALDASTTNPTGTKECLGKPVPLSDPQFGCSAPGCEPCSVAFAESFECKAGVCSAGKCKAGYGDCNGKLEDGCETPLTTPDSCGGCGVRCGTDQPFCKEGKCASDCGTLTPCGFSCVDLTKSSDHCGSCERKCPGAASAEPYCENSECKVRCNVGTNACDGNPAHGCGNVSTYYLDSDRDGHGNPATATSACAPPTANHVTLGDDCLDTNNKVFPGQTEYFGVTYTKTSGEASYDYDCDNLEEENPAFTHFPGQCTAACNESGYVVPPITRPLPVGGNEFCGSTTKAVCRMSGSGSFSCGAQFETAPPLPCH
jgi:hypothetical protein